MTKSWDVMRDCVKKVFIEGGCSRGDNLGKIMYAIIYELKRVGYNSVEIKDFLIEWNKKNEQPYKSRSEVKGLLNYVDWYGRLKNPKLGCRRLKDYGICIGEENCQYYQQQFLLRKREILELPFDMDKLKQYLSKRYKQDGYFMGVIVKALRCHQTEKVTGEIILIGIRGIISIIRHKYGHTLDRMYISRKINLLIDEGVFEKAVQGKSGAMRREANGYRFLPWKLPKKIGAPIRKHSKNPVVVQEAILGTKSVKVEGV